MLKDENEKLKGILKESEKKDVIAFKNKYFNKDFNCYIHLSYKHSNIYFI